MQLLRNTKTENYHEIEVKHEGLFKSYIVKYRLVDGYLYRYKHPNIYYRTGFSESIDILPLFSINPE